MTDETPTDTAAAVAPPARSLGLVKAVGVLGIIGGILLIVVGIIAWIGVTTQLTAENITIPDDAMAMQGQQVTGPITAYIQADIINHHALEASGGKTYAELDREDPARTTAMQASFLQASLFTSVVAFGVAALATVLGIVLVLIGWALRSLASSGVVRESSAADTAAAPA